MKKLIVIYETSKLHGRKRTVAQACCKIELDDQKARLLLSGKPEANIIRQAVEKLLETVELLRGRHYVRGSIKRFSSAFEESVENREDDL